MVELSCNEFGTDGPALVILHGLFGSARNWSGISKHFARTHRVFALDLRNHGSSGQTSSMTYSEMAADVAGFLHARNISAPVILGHSMGGKVAMQLALEDPDVLKGLIVVDIAPVTYGHDMLDYIAAMQMLDISGERRRQELEEELRDEVEDPAVTSFLMSNLERANGGYHWRVNLTAISAGMSGISGFDPPADATYDGPTLFIAGETSAYMRDSQRDGIAALFPKARTVTIKDAGHWVHADQPKAFIKTVDAFLKAVV